MVKLPVLPEKEFYTMGEVSLIAQVPAHTLRYWEKEIGTLRPSRLSSGHRRYTKDNLEMVFRIKDLIESKKMTSSGARQVLKKRRWPQAQETAGESIAASASTAQDNGTLEILRAIKKEIGALLEEMK